jgi:hypothetical protein
MTNDPVFPITDKIEPREYKLEWRYYRSPSTLPYTTSMTDLYPASPTVRLDAVNPHYVSTANSATWEEDYPSVTANCVAPPMNRKARRAAAKLERARK